MNAFQATFTLPAVILSGIPAGIPIGTPAGPPPRAAEGSIAHRTEVGDSRRATFSEEFQWELDSLAQIFGDAVVSEDTPPMTGSVTREFTVVDKFTETEGGALTAFEREFEEFQLEAGATIDFGERTEEYAAVLSSPLVGEELLFELGDDGFRATSPSSLDAEQLEGLTADAWLLALVPEDPVELEDSWTIEAADLPSLLAPGGIPTFSLSTMEGVWGEVMPSDVLAMALAHIGNSARDVEGSVEVTWVETRDEEGRALAELDLIFDVQLAADLEQPLMALFDEYIDGSPRKELRMEALWNLAGEGRASWDLDAGHFVDLEADLDAEVEIEMRWVQEMGGAEVEVGGDYEISGETLLHASCE